MSSTPLSLTRRPPSTPVSYAAASYERKGKGQDRHLISTSVNGVNGQILFSIYDGHGVKGGEAAEFVKERFLSHFENFVKNQQEIVKNPELDDDEDLGSEQIFNSLIRTYKLLDAELEVEGNKEGNEKFRDSGTTALNLYLHLPPIPAPTRSPIAKESTGSCILYTANVGDTRAVLCRNGVAIRWSYDHSPKDYQELRRNGEAGGTVSMGFVMGKVKLTRALGDSELGRYLIPFPFLKKTILLAVDEFVIMASDGFWDFVGDQAAVNLCRGLEAQAAVDVLMKQVRGHDDATVIVVRFQPIP